MGVIQVEELTTVVFFQYERPNQSGFLLPKLLTLCMYTSAHILKRSN